MNVIPFTSGCSASLWPADDPGPEEITIGDSLKEDVWMGPIANKQQLDNCLSYIAKGKQEGADLIFGGERLADGKYENGYYIRPAIFDNVTSGMTIAQEEIGQI